MSETRSLAGFSARTASFALFLSILFVCCGWIWTEYKGYEDQAAFLSEIVLKNIKNRIKDQVSGSVQIIEQMGSEVESRTRALLKQKVSHAYLLASQIYTTSKDTLPESTVKALIRETLRSLSFNEGRGYFFIDTLDGVSILFTDHPEYEGQNLLEVTNTDGARVVRDVIQIATNQGEGFYTYKWSKPGSREMKFMKSSYIKRFEPFGWVIGAGEYHDEIEATVQKEALERIGGMSFDKDSYIYVFRYDGLYLSHLEKKYVGQNLLTIEDSKGMRVNEKLVDLCVNQGGGFLDYTWKKPSTGKEVGKIAYVLPYPKWQWIIGTGVYLDDIDESLAKHKEAFKRKLLPQVVIMVVMAVFALIIPLAFIRRRAASLHRSFAAVGESFDNAFSATKVIDLENLGYVELKNLATSTNKIIEERKAAEISLSESERKLANALSMARLGHWDLDINSNIFTFSDSFYSLFLTSAEEMGGYEMSMQEYAERFIHPEDRHIVFEETQNALKTTDPNFSRYIEHRCIFMSGAIGYIGVKFSIEKDSAGNTIRTYGVNQDITERVRSEEALRESEMRFKALHNASFGGIAIHDNGIILDCNLGLTEMFGYTREELIGMNGLFLIAEISRDTVMKNIVSGYEKPYEEYGLRKNGEVFPMRLEGRNIPYKGKMVRAVEFRDITESRNSAEALLSAKETAEMANRAKSEFLANMSHEIRTPLNGVLGMLQLLQTTSPNDEQNEYLRTAINSARRLTRLLSDILDLSRIESGKLVVEEAEFDLASQRESVMELFGMTAMQKGVSLEFSISPELPVKLIGDEVRLRQILFNLVGNAVKFTQHGLVSVNVSLASNVPGRTVRILFTVSDTGIGIPDNRLKDIFEPFVQVEGSFVRAHQGAGLGLAIVRRLVIILGGNLAISDTQGGGTTIYVSLPFKLSDENAQSKKDELPITMDRHGVSLRILFVEDDAVNADTGRRILEKHGHFVVIAGDGHEAMQRLAMENFDLVLMDIQMPIMDGVEATKRIRRGEAGTDKSNIPIIAMTAYAMTGDKEKFLNAGMNDYLSKPVNIEALLDVIGSVMGWKKGALNSRTENLGFSG